MSDTAVTPIQFTPTGLVIPPQSQTLAEVQEDINAAFGGNLNFGTTDQPGGAPPQVQQAASTAAIISNNNETWAQFVNQVDPDFAEGFMQDAIGRIYFMNRKAGTPTSVQLLCGGDLNTPIPVGAQAQDTSGNIYICTQAVKIPAGGSILVAFANIVTGPIPCPANTVTRIYQGVPGWDTVTNPNAGTPGTDIESAADFEFRRQNSVAANGHGSLSAIYGAVFGVAGVIDAFATENDTDDPIDGPLGADQSIPNSTNYTVVPHSMYIGVVGGAAADIAQAIWTKKNEGSNMNGNTTVVVQDTSGYSFPQPSYTITFNRPGGTSYNFIINIKNSPNLPSTIIADVQGAVTQQFNGVTQTALPNGIIPATSGQRVRMASLLLAAAFYGPVATCEGPSVPVQVIQILIGSNFAGTGSVVTGSKTLTIATVTSGSLSPGTAITATGVPDGATIVQQLSGTPGGVGTYQLSDQATATTGTEAVTGAGSTAQQIGIDQSPVVGTITVNLV